MTNKQLKKLIEEIEDEMTSHDVCECVAIKVNKLLNYIESK